MMTMVSVHWYAWIAVALWSAWITLPEAAAAASMVEGAALLALVPWAKAAGEVSVRTPIMERRRGMFMTKRTSWQPR
jgi:hypothetical protein